MAFEDLPVVIRQESSNAQEVLKVFETVIVPIQRSNGVASETHQKASLRALAARRFSFARTLQWHPRSAFWLGGTYPIRVSFSTLSLIIFVLFACPSHLRLSKCLAM